MELRLPATDSGACAEAEARQLEKFKIAPRSTLITEDLREGKVMEFTINDYKGQIREILDTAGLLQLYRTNWCRGLLHTRKRLAGLS
jgi:hypothetical protein